MRHVGLKTRRQACTHALERMYACTLEHTDMIDTNKNTKTDREGEDEDGESAVQGDHEGIGRA